MSDKMLKLSEVADAANVSTQTVRRHISLGCGPQVTRIGRLVRVRPDALEAWLNRCAAPAPSSAQVAA